MAVGKFTRLGNEFRGQRIDAALALDHFQHDGRGAVAEGSFKRGQVVGRNEADAWDERFEIMSVLGLSGDGECAEGAAMEGILQRNDFVFFRMDAAAVRVRHF